MRFSSAIHSILLGTLLGPLTPFPIAIEPPTPVLIRSASRKIFAPIASDATEPAQVIPTSATLVRLHDQQIIVLSDTEPSPERFANLLRDRVTGDSVIMAPELLELLRKVTADTHEARVEFISGYRSWKLNEMLRKKGRNVASHSQHSLGKAMDFRLEGLSSKQLAEKIEKIGWRGGLAHYPSDTDRFVHANVGPHRRWRGR